MSPRRLLPLLPAVLLVLAACGGNKNIDPPSELTRFEATAEVQRAWSAGVGGGEPKLRLGLGVAVDGGRVFAAGHDGDVAAFDVGNGRRVWRTDTRLRLAGGPGAGAGMVVVGSSFGDLVALDGETGKERWRTRLNSEILSAPAVSDDLVAVRLVDGRIVGLNAADGSQRWSAEQQVPRLSLRGTASPVIVGDVVACGFDNGRVLAINRRDGTTVWEATVAPPSGRTELERLVDIDSAIRVAEEDLYVVSYQGRLARLGSDSGQVWWTRELSSYRGLAVDEDGVYVSTSDGEVVKVGRRTGVEMWRQKALTHRRLSPPAVLGKHVVVSDFEGVLHFLDVENGNIAARVGTGGERVSAAPVVVGEDVIVFDDEGALAAFRIRPPRS